MSTLPVGRIVDFILVTRLSRLRTENYFSNAFEPSDFVLFEWNSQ